MIFKILNFLSELTGWFQIVLSMLLVGIGLGLLLYALLENTLGLILGILIGLLGLVMGIFLATKKMKTTGTINSLSKK
jgi:F0F1-type ATP synthase assembly protein I